MRGRPKRKRYPYEGRTIVVERRNIVTGDRVTNAVQDYDPQNNLPQVSITLDGAGGDRMNDATKDNVGNQMAILYKELKPRSRTVVEDGKEVVQNYSVEEKAPDQRCNDPFGAWVTGSGSPAWVWVKRAIWRCCCERAHWPRRCTSSKSARSGRASVKTTFATASARRSAATCLVLLCMVVLYRAFGMIANVALGDQRDSAGRR